MKNEYHIVLETSKRKALAALALVEASLIDLLPYDASRNYTPKELEAYDALSDRFTRAVELCIQFFRAYEYYLFTLSSDTYRDLLLHMEKQQLITSMGIWIDMRNRIVHQYIPEQVKQIYDLFMGDFKQELLFVKRNIESLKIVADT